MAEQIRFFNDDIKFVLRNKAGVRQWIKKAIRKEGFILSDLHYIFCSDKTLNEINRHYLHHNTLTDIITFDLSITKKNISGEIYISIDRVRENADIYKVSFQDELNRVMIHGVLHLCGYKDKLLKDVKKVREREDYYLAQFR